MGNQCDCLAQETEQTIKLPPASGQDENEGSLQQYGHVRMHDARKGSASPPNAFATAGHLPPIPPSSACAWGGAEADLSRGTPLPPPAEEPMALEMSDAAVPKIAEENSFDAYQGMWYDFDTNRERGMIQSNILTWAADFQAHPSALRLGPGGALEMGLRGDVHTAKLEGPTLDLLRWSDGELWKRVR